MENMEEISQIVANELGNKQHKRKVRTDTLVYKMFGKPYKELTKEEQREYWVAKHKRDMEDEEKLVAKREYERERYKRRREYYIAKAKERHAEKCMASQKEK